MGMASTTLAGHSILHTRHIKDRFSRPTCNTTRTSRCRPEENFTRSCLTNYRVVYTARFGQRYFNQIFPGIVESFLDGIGNFVRFTKSMPYHAFTVSNYYNGIKTEPAPTFHNFGHTVDVYQFFFKI